MRVWIATYVHRFGTTVYVFAYEPSEKDVVRRIRRNGGEFEPEREEYIEISGPERVSARRRRRLT